jgi:hypothetical protein
MARFRRQPQQSGAVTALVQEKPAVCRFFFNPFRLPNHFGRRAVIGFWLTGPPRAASGDWILADRTTSGGER